MSAKSEKNKQQQPDPEIVIDPETPEFPQPEVPAEEAPAEDVPAKEASAEEVPAEEAPAEEEFDLEAAVAQYKTILAALDEAEAKALRLQADFDNFRRRSRKDAEDAIHLAAASLVGSLLPVLDNFDRAWAAMADGPDKDGVALINKQFLAALTNAGLKEIEAAGQPFDPNLHQAVSQAEVAEEEKGKITQVLQKGYMLNERLLRAAMVQVGC